MRMQFSVTEIRDIAISLAVLSIVFSYPDSTTNPALLGIALAVVGLGFIGHELSHKFAAIREGFWSEYRMWPQGLVMAFLLSIATGGAFVFAAPGAVYFRPGSFQPGPDRKQLTKISMSGITFNVALMWLTLSLYLTTGIGLLSYMAVINGWLAIFNLLPFGMLDGEKLFKLNRNIWMALFALAAAGFIAAQFM